MKFCPKCGAELADDAGFCPKCGTQQGNEQPVAAPVATPKAPEKRANAADVFSVFTLIFGILGLCLAIPGLIPLIGLVFNYINAIMCGVGLLGSIICRIFGKFTKRATTGIVLNAIVCGLSGVGFIIIAAAAASAA